jgi:hypothetical protein
VVEIVRPYGTIRIHSVYGTVETSVPGGRVVVATRPETDENIREAADEGYVGLAACFRALVDHEVLHILMPEWLGWHGSLVMAHESGSRAVPHGQRLYEEAMVLAFQRYLTTGDVWPALEPWRQRLGAWTTNYWAITVEAGLPQRARDKPGA